MALLKDLIVEGASRFIGDAYFNTIKSGIWNGSVIDVTHGGTGLSTFSSAGLVYANGLTAFTTKQLTTLISNGGAEIPTSGAVYTAIQNGFAANDAMLFAGTFAGSLTKATNATTLVGLFSNGITSIMKGATWRVSSDGYYGNLDSEYVEAGDLIIAIDDNPETTKSKYMVIQRNINVNDYVTKADTQTITGAKTFTSVATFNAGLVATSVGGSSNDVLFVSGQSSFNDIVNIYGKTNHGNHVLPLNNNSYDLGSSSLKWKNVYATTFTGNLSGNANTATDLASNPTIATTNNEATVTLSPNTAYTLTVGKKSVIFKTPTDTTVTLTGVSTNGEYSILFKKNANTTDETLTIQYGNTSGKLVTINPNKGSITAPGGFIGNVNWNNVTDKPINFKALSGSLRPGGWKTLQGKERGSVLTISLVNNNVASWNSSNYSSSLVYGVNDTRGLLDLSYKDPTITFGGGSITNSGDDNPHWYIKLSGTDKKTYNLDSMSSVLLNSCYTIKSSGKNGQGLWFKFATLDFSGDYWNAFNEWLFFGGSENTQVTPNGILTISGIRNGNDPGYAIQFEIKWLSLNNNDYKDKIVAIKTDECKFDIYILSCANYITMHIYRMSYNESQLQFNTSSNISWITNLPSPVAAISGEATTITSSLAGYSYGADRLTTAITLTIGNSDKSFDGTNNVSWTLNEINARLLIDFYDNTSSANDLKVSNALVNKGTPTSEWYHITTDFYSSLTDARFQYAGTYKSDEPELYIRHIGSSSGAWTAWRKLLREDYADQKYLIKESTNLKFEKLASRSSTNLSITVNGTNQEIKDLYARYLSVMPDNALKHTTNFSSDNGLPIGISTFFTIRGNDYPDSIATKTNTSNGLVINLKSLHNYGKLIYSTNSGELYFRSITDSNISDWRTFSHSGNSSLSTDTKNEIISLKLINTSTTFYNKTYIDNLSVYSNKSYTTSSIVLVPTQWKQLCKLNDNDLLDSDYGTYVVQITKGSGSEFVFIGSGVMSFGSQNSSALEEIVLHCYGGDDNRLYLGTQGDWLMGAAKKDLTSTAYTITFKRII